MPDDEVLDEVTSEELGTEEMTSNELLAHFQKEVKEDEKVENPKEVKSECKGNILTECVRDGLEELEDTAYETGVEYSIIGGIGTQLRGLADCEDIVAIGDHFGRRQTADIDVLVRDQADGITLERAYDDTGKPHLDTINGHIPGDEDIIDDSELVDFSSIDERCDFAVYIPTNEDLIYSKVWNPSLEEKEGTRYDLQKYADLNGYVFDVNEAKLRDTVRERSTDLEASIDYMIRSGIDI